MFESFSAETYTYRIVGNFPNIVLCSLQLIHAFYFLILFFRVKFLCCETEDEKNKLGPHEDFHYAVNRCVQLQGWNHISWQTYTLIEALYKALCLFIVSDNASLSGLIQISLILHTYVHTSHHAYVCMFYVKLLTYRIFFYYIKLRHKLWD